jgi:hypothetical protein
MGMSDDFTPPEYLHRFAKNGTEYDRDMLAQAVISLMQGQLSDQERAAAQTILQHIMGNDYKA